VFAFKRPNRGWKTAKKLSSEYAAPKRSLTRCASSGNSSMTARKTVGFVMFSDIPENCALLDAAVRYPRRASKMTAVSLSPNAEISGFTAELNVTRESFPLARAAELVSPTSGLSGRSENRSKRLPSNCSVSLS